MVTLKPSNAATWIQCPAAAGLIAKMTREKPPAPTGKQVAGTAKHVEVEAILKGKTDGH